MVADLRLLHSPARAAYQDVLDAWLGTLDGQGTKTTYRRTIELAFRVMGVTDVAAVTAADVAMFKASMSALKPATVALRLAALRGLFQYAVATGLVQTDPTVTVKLPKVHQGSPRALTLAQAKKIAAQVDINTIVGKRDAAAIALLFGGLRVSEVGGLNVGGVRLEHQDGHTFTRVSVVGKGNKPRDVDLPARVFELVQVYLDVRPGPRDEAAPLFLAIATGFRGECGRLPANRIYRQLVGYARRAGVKITGSHCGRHTWAKLAEESGAKLMDVMAHLGHANLNVTATYLRRLTGKRNPASDAVPVVER
jgi:site-specific recombinase XerC